ncbi:MAG: hypothetical protein JNM09_29185 [Blastocatellia bacterium]|nr:hypothetical protein [Blastocatellia bacterium]
MTTKNSELALECQRQSENCLYTSTSFFIWLRLLRKVRVFFIVTPLVLGGLASWNLLTKSDVESVKVVTAVCSFLAGLFPTIYAALKFDDQLEKYTRFASEFKNLQDRFRQAALVSSRKPFAEFEKEFKELMVRMEQARSASLTPPEWIFKRAQKKVQSSDYKFDVDLALSESGVEDLQQIQDQPKQD